MRLFGRRAEPEDRAHLAVYLRPDGYYLIRSDRAVTGVWLGRAERPVVLERELAADLVGARVLELVAERADVVPHPEQHEWTEQQRAFRAPIVAAARVRSWRAFITPAELVDVSRDGSVVTVTRMRHDSRRHDVFVPYDAPPARLSAPLPEELGEAILVAFSQSEPEPR